jgi:vacuolar-type H+-ATPase catalytic subunit A/Vma1
MTKQRSAEKLFIDMDSFQKKNKESKGFDKEFAEKYNELVSVFCEEINHGKLGFLDKLGKLQVMPYVALSVLIEAHSILVMKHKPASPKKMKYIPHLYAVLRKNFQWQDAFMYFDYANSAEKLKTLAEQLITYGTARKAGVIKRQKKAEEQELNDFITGTNLVRSTAGSRKKREL